MFPFRPGQVAGYGIVALLVLAVGWRYLQRPPEPPPAAPPPAVAEVAAPAAVVVAVSGEVRRPGVYRLAGGARVQDAVARARPTRRADLESINLAARLADGEQVVVPRRGAPAASVGGSGGDGGDAGGGIVHLNSATQAELEGLDGIGPALASRIIEYRDEHGGFASVEELDEVSGIGPARLAALADHVAP